MHRQYEGFFLPVHQVEAGNKPASTEQDLRFTLLFAGALDRRLST
jgi:hypothetical protein